MFKAQFKKQTVYETWTTIGSYGTDTQAISAAMNKKNQGVIMVRVVDKKGAIVFVN
jgi:hypothetical protein